MEEQKKADRVRDLPDEKKILTDCLEVEIDSLELKAKIQREELASMRKQNELLDVEIELLKVKVNREKALLQIERNDVRAKRPELEDSDSNYKMTN